MNILIGIYVGLIVFKFRNITLFFIWLFVWGPPPKQKKKKNKNKNKNKFSSNLLISTLGQITNVELFILLFGKQIPLLLRRIVDKQFLYYIGPNRIEICVEYRTKYNYSRSSHTHTKKFKNKCFFTFFTFHPLTFSNFFYLRIKIKSCFS